MSMIGNTTITHCRPTHSTMRKSNKTFTVTRHLKDNNSKATSCSLLFVKMIAKLEVTQGNTKGIPKQRTTQNRHKKLEVHKTIDQRQQNHRLNTDSSLSYRGLKYILVVPNLCPRICSCQNTMLFSSHGGFLLF